MEGFEGPGPLWFGSAGHLAAGDAGSCVEDRAHRARQRNVVIEGIGQVRIDRGGLGVDADRGCRYLDCLLRAADGQRDVQERGDVDHDFVVGRLDRLESGLFHFHVVEPGTRAVKL